MVRYGNDTISLMTIPKGTLLFRAIDGIEADFKGVDGCMPPHYNVFFYFSPFVVDGIAKWYSERHKMQIYVVTHDLKIASLVHPSKLTRAARFEKGKFIVSCNKTKRSCLKPRKYDACFRDTFIQKHPHILGYIALSKQDVLDYHEGVKKGLVTEERQSYVHSIEDASKLKGPPELSIYPLNKRVDYDLTPPPTDPTLFNYKHIGTFMRADNSLETFMRQHAEKNRWFYVYKE